MARQDALSSSRQPTFDAQQAARARSESFAYGHASSIGCAHGTAHAMARTDGTKRALPAPPVADHVSLIMDIDERKSPVVALGLRAHPEARPLRPSLFPPRAGQRLPTWGLPTSAAAREARFHQKRDAADLARKALGPHLVMHKEIYV